MELEGEFGGGFLAGAGAVEDDVAVARDDLAVLVEFVGADAERRRVGRGGRGDSRAGGGGRR